MSESWKRRYILKAALAAIAGGVLGGTAVHTRKPFLLNPCKNPEDAALENAWLDRIWQGLDPAKVWDCHTHLAGIGDSENGLRVGENLESLWHPVLYGQRLFYINAGCVSTEPGTVDENYVRRLAFLVRNMPAGVKTLLFAFDWYHDDAGASVPELSTFYVPDQYAHKVAAENPDIFEWAASIHPYRPDALDRLEQAASKGAKAVKWLPAAQNIDPALKRCDPFYAVLARLRLPLIIHCGEEKAVQGSSTMEFGNPLRIRRALDAGVKVVVAHCASTGRDEDLDHPGKKETSFALFTRLMENPAWRGNLFGDISAIVLRNRNPEVLKLLLSRKDWHDRLLNGSDYPLPGILPLISLSRLTRHGLLNKEDADELQKLRPFNALYFDFALKRCLNWQGQTFSARVFETRSFFETA